MRGSAYKIKKYLKIFVYLKKLNFQEAGVYKMNLVLMFGSICIQMLLSLILIKTIFGFIGEISGWTYFKSLIVLSSYMIIDGLMWAIFGQLGDLQKHIEKGTLDNLLVKPIDTQFLVSAWRGDLEDLSRILIGTGLLVYATGNLSFPLNELIFYLFLYCILLLNGLIIAYSIALVIKSIGFWYIKSYALYNIYDSLLQITRFPTDIFFNKFVRLFLTLVIPLAFIATIPAKMLTQSFNWQLIFGSFVIAGVFFTLSRAFWKYALKHYSSASS